MLINSNRNKLYLDIIENVSLLYKSNRNNNEKMLSKIGTKPYYKSFIRITTKDWIKAFGLASVFFTQLSMAETDTKSQETKLQADSPKTYSLESVVTTASGFSQSTLLAPASISVVSPKDLQSRPFRDLAEALSLVPGVDIDNGVGKTGGYGISIRGMSNEYTLVLIDGKRVDSNIGEAVFPNGFNSASTSFMPPITAIDRIEVIRGPASTLYGSDAIGGVVNIITKKSFDKWGATIQADTTLQEKKYFGNSYGLSFFTSGPLTKAKDFGLILRGKYYVRERVPTENLKIVPNGNGTSSAGRGNIVGLSHAQIYNVGSRLLWNDGKADDEATLFSPKNSAYFDIDFGHQFYDNRDSLLGTYDKEKGGYDWAIDYYRTNAILNYDGVFIKNPDALIQNLTLNASLQYNGLKNDGRTIPTSTFPAGNGGCSNGFCGGDPRGIINHDIIADIKSNIFFNVNSYFAAKTSFGARYWMNIFNDNVMGAAGANSTLTQHIGALFGESEFILWDKLFLTTGIRGNFNSIFGANISPRVYASYNVIDEWLVIKGGVSTGYKSPLLNKLVPGIVNFSGQGKYPIYGNPNLKPESSINYELSVLSDNEYFSASVTGFFTDFKDKIDSISGIQNGTQIPMIGVQCNAGNSNTCSVSVNRTRAFSYGMELYGEVKPIFVGYGDISLNLAYTLNNTNIEEGPDKGKQLTDIPLHNLNAGIFYNTKYFGVSLRSEFKAGHHRGLYPSSKNYNQIVGALGEYYKPYVLAHLGFNFNITKQLKANFAIYNLFDFNFIDYVKVDAINGSDEQYYNNFNYIREGRRYYLSLSYEF